MKTLKYEEVYRQEYRDLPDALRSLRRFLENVYNEKHRTRPWAICPPSSRPICCWPTTARKLLRGNFLYEFFQASGNLSIRCDSIGRGTTRPPLPGSSSRMSFRLVIPRRVAVLQRWLPLRQPAFILQHWPVLGKQCLNFLCHVRGQPQNVCSFAKGLTRNASIQEDRSLDAHRRRMWRNWQTH
jgi:hypothetical protein